MAEKQVDIIKGAVKDALNESEGLPFCRIEGKRIEELEKIVVRLSTLVTGNGTPENGLVLKSDRASQAINELREATKKRSDREWMIFGGMLLLIATNLIQIAF